MPAYAVAFGFFAFASAGLPGLSGFVGEFLSLVGAFLFSPWVAAVATVCMILAAAYLLWMYQRLFFGEVSAFLDGLRGHLPDLTATEILTLTPLAALVVVFGVFPGLVLDLIQGSVTNVLSDVASATAIEIAPEVAAIAILAPIVYVLIRVATSAASDARAATDAGGAVGTAGAGR